MKCRILGFALAAGCAVAAPALAQSNGDAAGMAANYTAEYAAGLDDLVIEAGTACYIEIVDGLSADDRAMIAAAPDFIAGINALSAAQPELRENLFSELDSCVALMAAQSVMWNWVRFDYLATSDEEEQSVLGTCLMSAVTALTGDAKRGVARFRYGNFHAAIEAMLFERPDLAGTIVEDMAVCGITVEPNLALPAQ